MKFKTYLKEEHDDHFVLYDYGRSGQYLFPKDKKEASVMSYSEAERLAKTDRNATAVHIDEIYRYLNKPMRRKDENEPEVQAFMQLENAKNKAMSRKLKDSREYLTRK